MSITEFITGGSVPAGACERQAEKSAGSKWSYRVYDTMRSLSDAIATGDVVATAAHLASGRRPTFEELSLALQPERQSLGRGLRSYRFRSKLLRLLAPYLAPRHYAALTANVENVEKGIQAEMVLEADGLDEALRIATPPPPPAMEWTEAPHCAIGRSRIAGEGLFAAKPFAIGDEVANYAASFQQWPRLRHEYLPQWAREACWWVGEDLEYCRLVAVNSTFARTNHSRTPNTLWFPAEHRLVASQLISAGDEITYDYRLEIAPPAMKANPPPWA